MPSVRDLMTKDNTTIYLNETVFDAARLMSEKLVGCLVVMDGEMPVGIVTERDFVRNARARAKNSGDISICRRFKSFLFVK